MIKINVKEVTSIGVSHNIITVTEQQAIVLIKALVDVMTGGENMMGSHLPGRDFEVSVERK